MKRVSINSFAILSIILATFSAFNIRKEHKPFTINYQIWGISSNISCPPTLDQILGATRILLIHGASAFDFDGAGGISSSSYLNQLSYACDNQDSLDPEHFSDFNTFFPDKNIECATNANRTCMVYIIEDTNCTGSSILAVKCGVFSVIEEDSFY